jgi:aspartyl/asparaginyl beta-hydroxylase (cupin superfamily)
MKVRTAAFSILVPGAHILPHSGYVGYSDRVLRAHLGLQVPPGAEVGAKFAPTKWEGEARAGSFLRAGDEKWGWRNGEVLVFDDTHLHEAWNFTKQERVILLLDFERPPSFMPPQSLVDAMEKESSKDPFKVGNRGNEYLDALTSQNGWEEVLPK